MANNLDRVMVAISDPTRRAIISRLARGRARISDVAAPFPLRDVARWVSRYERFWNSRLDRLEGFFAAKQEQSK
jgi:hypothetical protein